MTQGGEEGNRDSKILCCYYRMRSTSTGARNETFHGIGRWENRLQEFGGPNYEIREKEPTSISRMGRPISRMPSII